MEEDTENMTEKEIREKINECDYQIDTAYKNLRNSARDVGTRGYDAAKNAQANAFSEASGSKTKMTLLPLLITLFGFFIFKASWFFGICMIIGGVVLSYNLNQSADRKQKEIQAQYNQMVNETESQQKNLNSVLDKHVSI